MPGPPLELLLVDPADELGQLRAALDDADRPIRTSVISGLEPDRTADQDPDCVVVAESETTDGRAMLELALSQFDVPIVAFVIGFDETFVVDAKSMGASDVISVPETGDGAFPDAMVGRLERAANVGRSTPSKAAVLDALLENYPHQLYVKNDQHQHEIVSRSTAAEYDLPRDQLRGLTDYELVGESAPELHAEEREIMQTGEPIVNDIEQYVDDGEPRWVSTTKAPRYEDGEIVGIVGSARDVTEQKRREAKMNALHAASRELVAARTSDDICAIAVDISDGVPDLPPVQVLLADHDGLTPVASETSVALDDSYLSLFETSYEDSRAMLLDTDGRRWRPDHPLSASEIDAVALPLGDHGVLGLVADEPIDEFTVELADVLAANLKVALDRAEREQALALQNEHLEEFAQIVSHDLRNPLSVAQGYLGLLETDEEVVEEIDWALDRMESLIEELLTLAKNGQVVSETELLSLPELAREAWQHVETDGASLTVREQQSWTTTRSSGADQLHADRDRLLELLENLFRNAIEHGSTSAASEAQSPNKLRVIVGSDEEGFYVEDNGPGIPDAKKDAVFGQGYTTAEDGTGFGLYIVETLADAHGWEVSVHDAQESETGARFEIRT
ncbi:ATP-binding protein [Natranaeroarchaeum aerophilus]|uniref:histidine kinase n=1 Tax=Natranaeroarchaeum aerophilus TaxID=2917711 RepID=A0AAE3K443_9EURY|nr:ATP-binding protein [Natranaeroarchaeum aerophilus]MCL9812968.1 PAS domain-containing sensor histidine kinase [Natranaeroarchaeum aerophilus]